MSLLGLGRLATFPPSLLILGCISYSALAVAQTSRVSGAIQGTVFDQTQSALAGAQIIVRNQGTGQSRTLSADPEGTFRVGELSVGQYQLRVESPGFTPYVNNAIVVLLGRVLQVMVQLVPATVQQEVTVSEELPSMDATQTSVATTIGSERIEEAPVVSRNYLDFVLLAPQLSSSNHQGSAGGSATLPDSGFTFAGLRPRSNTLYIDGLENNDEFTGSARTELSPETVHEFQVVNNGLSAESGGGAGGSINVITKSGVNRIHGDAFLFIQNGALNAKEPLTNERERPHLNRYRAGLSAGGPIVRNRTFYYVAGEQEGSHGDDSSFISPTVASTINRALSRRMLSGISTRFINPELFPVERAETETSARLDHQVGSEHSLFVKYAITNNREAGDAFNSGGLVDASGRGSTFVTDQGVSGSLTSVLSNTVLNSVRVQVSTRKAVLRTTDQVGPEISIAGLIDFGRPYEGNGRRRENHYEVIDVLSVQKRRYLFSVGVDADWIHENVSAYDGFGALYIFPTLASFLNGQPDQYRQRFGDATNRFTVPKYAGFFQDHWTVADHFTVDAGLRFDFEHLPNAFNQDRNNFAPRIGIAYSPSSTWVLRSGFGVFYDRYLLAALNRALETRGGRAFEQVADGQAATQIFQSQLGGSAITPNPSIRPSISTADPNLRTSYSEIVSLGVEHLLTKNLTATATFLLARGVKLPRTRNVNLPLAILLDRTTASAVGIPTPFPQELGMLVFPETRLGSTFDNVYQWEDRAHSGYNGLSLSLSRRLANEVEFSGSYTLSKAIDDASDFDEQPQNPHATRAERARSANDQRHRFVFSGTFDLPIGEKEAGELSSRILTLLFGNIEAAPILVIGSGRPVNPLTGFDANRSDAFPLSSRPLGFGRNSLTTSSQVQLDLRVLKFFKMGEHAKLDLVAESFNALNHTNVTALNPFFGPNSLPIAAFDTPNKAGIARQMQFSIDFEF